MRVILGIRRCIHFTVSNLHKLTALDRLCDRREQSVRKFMLDDIDEKIHFRLRSVCVKRAISYSVRSPGYIVPRFNTNVGKQSIAVRGLKLLNQQG
jgi:hypothetical protein